jgi:hypothetical protein
MSAALSTIATAALPPPPDPDRAGERAFGAGRFAGLLRRVFNCGKELLVAVRLRAHRPDFPRYAMPFGTNYLPYILRRIDAAMRRAVLLEHQALQHAGVLPPSRIRDRAPFHRAASHDVASDRAASRDAASLGVPSNDATSNDAASNDAPSLGESRVARRDAELREDALPAPARSQRTVRPARPSGDPHYAGWPSTKQLAAELRRRPIAVVLAGICRDLGITPHHPLWQDMCQAITAYGGSVEALEQDAETRWCSKRWLEIPYTPPPFHAVTMWPAPWSHPVTAAEATGPP